MEQLADCIPYAMAAILIACAVVLIWLMKIQ